ncbi:MAG: hypothetical protein NT079_00005 [Candidatus Omnitrophica bacterium]|nr:hypothetical protein [Candidatus Omnitrophota bacterium]
MKEIYGFKSSAEAGMMISLLKSHKFHPLEIQPSNALSFAGLLMRYYVQIPEKEYNSAKKFLIEQGYRDIL